MTQSDLTARIDATVEKLLAREARHTSTLFPDESCAIRQLLLDLRADRAAQAEALATVRQWVAVRNAAIQAFVGDTPVGETLALMARQHELETALTTHPLLGARS